MIKIIVSLSIIVLCLNIFKQPKVFYGQTPSADNQQVEIDYLPSYQAETGFKGDFFNKKQQLKALAKKMPNRRLTKDEVQKFVGHKFYEKPKKVLSSTEVKNKVKSYFRDVPLLVKITGCESSFRQYDENGYVLRGEVDPSDVGATQINLTFHLKEAYSKGLDPFIFEDNLRYAKYIYKKDGVKHWNASKRCLDKTYLVKN